jgi:hypothetical protein
MKKAFNLFIAITLFVQTFAQTSKDFILDPDPYQATISYGSVWDTVTNNWERVSVTTPVFTNGILDRVVTTDFKTGEELTRVVYSYNYDENYSLQLTQGKDNGEWLDYRRNFWYYNEDDVNIDVVIQFFRSGNWVNVNRYFEYTYTDGKLISYENQSWQGDYWRSHATENWYYNSEGYLVLRQRVTLTGINIYRVIYELNKSNQKEIMTTQLWVNNEWVDRNRSVYIYNNCGSTEKIVNQNFLNGEWVNSTMTESEYQINTDLLTGKKVAICHNGHTIYVSKNAVKAHLAHGDCLGECAVEKKSERERERDREREKERVEHKKVPFTVYPNPARERITVRFDRDDCGDSKIVELTDFYGKKIRSYKVKGNSDLTIPRGNLLDGKYYLRVRGEETYSVIVIFN